MKCSSCQREIKSMYAYTLLVSGKAEAFVGNFCGSCWYDLVPREAARILNGLSAKISGQPAEREAEVVGRLPG